MKIKFTSKFYQRLDEISNFIYTESKSKALTVRYIIQLKKHILIITIYKEILPFL